MELSINNITKKYNDKTAVNDVSLTLTPGIWGLLGANGAGKTTLMRMITGILTPTSGTVQYNGTNITALSGSYRNALGYLPQSFGGNAAFTVGDYLNYIAALKGLPKNKASGKIDELLNILTLTDVKSKRIKKLSGGMQRRVGIAQAMLNEPDILVLDEPTSGLDPGERVRFRNLLAEFAQNRIVLISTHIVSDVEYIAARNAILKAGKLLHVGRTEELIAAMQGKVYLATIPSAKLSDYEKATHIVSVRNESDRNISVRYLADAADIPNSEPAEPRLEDLYLWLFRNENIGKDVPQ